MLYHCVPGLGSLDGRQPQRRGAGNYRAPAGHRVRRSGPGRSRGAAAEHAADAAEAPRRVRAGRQDRLNAVDSVVIECRYLYIKLSRQERQAPAAILGLRATDSHSCGTAITHGIADRAWGPTWTVLDVEMELDQANTWFVAAWHAPCPVRHYRD